MTDTNFARALDLTRAVTDILNKSGVIGSLVGQVMKWLTCEGIPEGEFAYCLEKSKALIYPNDYGLEIRSRLRESDAKLKAKSSVAGLKLVGSLSIGRWMTDDPNYCYLVTTVAALFTYHDMAYASEAVCDMLLNECNHEGGTSKLYRYEKSRLLPVVNKIVESIILHVFNGSGNFDNLPEEIRRTCGHHIDSHTFAAAAMAVSRSSGDVIIRCNRFLADLYVWLLAHIEGDLNLSVAGKIIHRATSGRPLRSVTMLTDEACSENHGKIASTLVLSVDVGGTLHTLLRYTADQAEFCGSPANSRQSFYDLKGYNRAYRLDAILTDQELREVHIAGQRIVRWLMARPVTTSKHLSQIVYSTRPDDCPIYPGVMTVEALLSRWPAICNLDFGSGPSGYSFEAPDALGCHEPRTITVRDMLHCFPHARAIIEHARTRCRCTSCRTQVSRTGKHQRIVSKFGCLAHSAENHFVLIIAHAVADGFGTPDASNLGDFLVVRKGVQQLLSELVYRKRIAWKTWFSLAACTYLGCEWPVESGPNLARAKFAELVAVQQGSAVVVAPWVDIHSALAPQGSFGCFVATGQLLGMSTEFGVLYTENTSPPAVTKSDWKLPECHTMTADISEIALQTVINPSSGLPFRLSIIVRAGNYLRIINPANAVMALSRSAHPSCSHDQLGGNASEPPHPLPNQTWSAEHALGLWDSSNRDGDRVRIYPTYCTEMMDNVFKINILLALSLHGCVVKQDDCCSRCAEVHLDRSNLKSMRIILVSDSRYSRPDCVSSSLSVREGLLPSEGSME
jgi:hypothetical protein